jgi:hypothetical protein
MSTPEIALERYLKEKHRRGEGKFAGIVGRLPVEDLPESDFRRWLVKWMNQQLKDIGVNSTDGTLLPRLHFDLVRVRGDAATAHVFRTDEPEVTDEFAFIVVSEPMVDRMHRLSSDFIRLNGILVRQRITSLGALDDIAQFLVFLQFCFVTSHEYSHLVRRHLEDHQPNAVEIGAALPQVQELDADGYGIYLDLTYLIRGSGRQLALQMLRVYDHQALEKATVDCFLLSIMIQFCERWAGKIQVESDLSAEYPPPPVRIENALLFIEMWCREVGKISTAWTVDGTLQEYFSAAARLFPTDLKTAWNEQIQWLKSPESEEYRERIRAYLNRIRRGET